MGSPEANWELSALDRVKQILGVEGSPLWNRRELTEKLRDGDQV